MKTTSPYKTAVELGIEQWEHDGLLALVGPLSRGELHLDMQTTGHLLSCGSVHCIGGWVAFYADRLGAAGAAYVSAAYGLSLGELYFPRGDRRNHKTGWKASSGQAAQAVVNFLTLGDPRWDDVMSGRDAARETLDALHALYVADFDADDSGCVAHAIGGDA